MPRARTPRPTGTRVRDVETLDDLTHEPIKARVHTERNLDMIERSLVEVGAGRSIAIDEDGMIMAGNGTVIAARRAGIRKVRVIDSDGTEIIAVRRTGLTPDQKQRMVLFDNRAAEMAEWDAGALSRVSDAGISLDGLFTDSERFQIEMLQAAGEPVAVTPDAEGPTETAQAPETAADGQTTPRSSHILFTVLIPAPERAELDRVLREYAEANGVQAGDALIALVRKGATA